MDFKKKPFNFFTLWIEAFKLANKTFGTLLLLFSLFVAFVAFFLLVLWVVGTKMVLPGAMTAPFLAALSTGVMGLIAGYMVRFIFPCTLTNMLAARANKEGKSLPECFSRSIVPSFYLLLATVLIWVASLITGWVFKSTNSVLIAGLGLLVSLLFITLPCSFTTQALALRGENPITAIKYSVDLVFRRYFSTSFLLLSIWLMPFILLGCIVLGLLAGIPFVAGESFDITRLSVGWYGVLLVAFAMYVFSIYYAFTAKTLLFLNLDYGLNRASFELEDASIMEKESSSTVLPVNAGMPVQAPKQDIITPNAQVGMLKATVSAEDSHLQEISNQKPDQVYAPTNLKVQEYMHQEEDRMPTILFDDDMAAEMAKNQEILEKQKEEAANKQQNNGPDNIKLSKR